MNTEKLDFKSEEIKKKWDIEMGRKTNLQSWDQMPEHKTETMLDMIRNEHRMAVKKHPNFAETAMRIYFPSEAKDALAFDRSRLNYTISHGAVTGVEILRCELAEAQAAYSDGDLDHALVELAQCAAVIIRMMEMVEKESEGTK